MGINERNISTGPQRIAEFQGFGPVATRDIPECRALGLRIHRQITETGIVVHWAAHELHVATYHANGGTWSYSS